jgi:hypothetical protein
MMVFPLFRDFFEIPEKFYTDFAKQACHFSQSVLCLICKAYFADRRGFFENKDQRIAKETKAVPRRIGNGRGHHQTNDHFH